MVAHIDDDNQWKKDHFEKLVACFVENKELGMAFGLHRYIEQKTQTSPNTDRYFRGGTLQLLNMKYFSDCNFIASDDVLISRKVYEKIGGMNERLCFFADWEYWLKITHSFPVAQICEILSDYTLHQESITSKISEKDLMLKYFLQAKESFKQWSEQKVS